MMNLTSNGNGNGHGNGHSPPYLKIGLLVLAILLVGFLLYRQVTRSYGPVQTVWVAAADLDAGDVLTAEGMKEKRMRERSLPAGAIQNPAQAQGRRLRVNKAKGKPFVGTDFSSPRVSADPLTDMVPEGRILMTVRVGPKTAPITNLRRGDRLDILAAGKGKSGGGRMLTSDAFMMGYIGPKDPSQEQKKTVMGFDLTPPTMGPKSSSPSALLVAVHPDDVFPVAQAQAMGTVLSVLIHAAAEHAEGGQRTEIPIPPSSKPTAVELIAGSKRQQVVVKR
jgi:Flp pilus assembly protein CpaB